MPSEIRINKCEAGVDFGDAFEVFTRPQFIGNGFFLKSVNPRAGLSVGRTGKLGGRNGADENRLGGRLDKHAEIWRITGIH